ncbi:ribonuclease H family protein [Protaetiibacter mangrovi]|uniref:ribonuclease H n=1 Tax=Protaetiibacter mangrovi TaxID=2970926 RepID=A0ABT1ZDI9_9MICO|nr:ribonuclease H [Protaetiibacter mangrovi]MCS0498771.1 ribonuclease HI [Protaetiibacter mangrovi]TPX05853.1 ribonuclease HI [Schumannella luteola]
MTASDRYVLATDGACKGNPGPAGWAWVGEDGEWAAGSLPSGTNNIGELLGLLNAIRDHAQVRELVVQADSKYAIDTYSSWMDGHKRRGWLTSAKKPVANREILEQLIAVRDARRAAGLPDVVLEHVRGHAGHRLNSWADERAVRASQHAAKGEESQWSSLGGVQPKLDVSVDPPRGAADRVGRR